MLTDKDKDDNFLLEVGEMKKYLLIVVCCAGMALATDYNPLTDWVLYPGSPDAWTFGGRIETGYGTGVFGDLIAGEHMETVWGPIPDGEGWTVPDTAGTCTIWWKDPWQAKSGPIMNAWTSYQATARVTPEAGIYDLSVLFDGTGYAGEIQTTNVYVVKNGTDVLWQGLVSGYGNAGTSLAGIALNAGDYLDLISGNGSDSGESRTALTADLTFVSEIPEPATMALLGLGALFLRKRK